MLSIEQAKARAQTLAFLTVMNLLLSKPWHMEAPSKK